MAAGVGVFGPYERPTRSGELRWIVITRTVPGGAGQSHSFASERAAEDFIREERPAVEHVTKTKGRTLTQAIDAYDRHLETEGYKQRTETIRRIRSFFADHLDTQLRLLTAARAAAIYKALQARKATRYVGSGKSRKLVELDKPIATDTHRGMLTHTRTFLTWCVGQRWLRSNPLAAVKGRGKLRHGKPQLRIDEARRWYEVALGLAESEAGALAALTALLLGLRATEATKRVVRDVDDGGRLLWIPDSKTPAGRRTVEIPSPLRPHLRRLAKGRAGDALLFGGIEREGGLVEPHLRGWVLFWTKKICAAAGVPKVSAHSLRGLHATLAMQAGATSHLVAGALGHESDAVTLGSYAAPGSGHNARTAKALGVLTGGRRRR